MLKKEEGNDFFKNQDMVKSEIFYKEGILCLELVANLDDMMKELLVILYQNLALVYNNTNRYIDSIKYSTQALQIDPDASKALFRRSVAYKCSRNF